VTGGAPVIQVRVVAQQVVHGVVAIHDAHGLGGCRGRRGRRAVCHDNVTTAAAAVGAVLRGCQCSRRQRRKRPGARQGAAWRLIARLLCRAGACVI
jgi:hypothetical protein